MVRQAGERSGDTPLTLCVSWFDWELSLSPALVLSLGSELPERAPGHPTAANNALTAQTHTVGGSGAQPGLPPSLASPNPIRGRERESVVDIHIDISSEESRESAKASLSQSGD